MSERKERPGDLETVVVRGFTRNYRGQPVKDRHQKAHCPYSGHVHDERTDEDVDWRKKLWEFLSDEVPEGEVVEIVVRRTGVQSPKADDPWVLVKPHVYGPNSSLKGPS